MCPAKALVATDKLSIDLDANSPLRSMLTSSLPRIRALRSAFCESITMTKQDFSVSVR
ncbi:hypothetical protein LV43_02332 [Acinetobacter baumannii]|nr:hypothetical protein LV43_02332 [Acinetobacter baumannii]